MTSKERVLRAVNHQEVDRIPSGLFGTHPDYLKGLADHIGAASVEEMFRQLGIDVWHGWGQRLEYAGPPRLYKGVPVNEWGLPVKSNDGYSHNLTAPLADVLTIDAVEAFPWPSPDDYFDPGLAEYFDAHREFAVVGGINSAIFHIYSWMCGFDYSMMLLGSEPDVAKAIIRHITDFWAGYLRKLLQIGNGRIDIIENCNDFGTQISLFISPDYFREFFRPALQRLYDITHEHGAKVMQHSCGAVAPLISDFIEMGADILNPIQVSADGMDLNKLVPAYGRQICFYGGIDTQYVMPRGPVELIQRKSRELIERFGYNGGLILAGSQGLMNDIPYDHALAMLREPARFCRKFHKWGREATIRPECRSRRT